MPEQGQGSVALWVKICGVRRLQDVEAVRASGADAIGFNLVPASPRFIPEAALGPLFDAARDLERVAVVADRSQVELFELLERFAFDRVQLHGHESAELLANLDARFYKAVRIADAADVARAQSMPGERVLVDASVPGMLGGSGRQLDVALLPGLVAARRVVLAGGLTPDNVSAAVRAVRPFGVDVASGVETAPGEKDAARVRAFVAAARGA